MRLSINGEPCAEFTMEENDDVQVISCENINESGDVEIMIENISTGTYANMVEVTVDNIRWTSY